MRMLLLWPTSASKTAKKTAIPPNMIKVKIEDFRDCLIELEEPVRDRGAWVELASAAGRYEVRDESGGDGERAGLSMTLESMQ